MSDILEIYKPGEHGAPPLRPCPFCGSSEVVYDQYPTAVGARWRVVCMGCMASVDPGWAQQWSVVQEMWNRRAEPVRYGKWLNVSYDDKTGLASGDCSVCKQRARADNALGDFCPHCGARMENGGDN